MKKIIIVLFLSTTFYSFAQNTIGVTTTDVNVRWKASLRSKIIKTFSKGTEVVLLQTKGSWSFIKDPTNNKKGWVSSKYIQTNIRVVTKNANVRSSAGGKILKKIAKGKKVILLQEKGSWCFVKDISNNKKGWVHSSLLSTSNTTSLAVSPSKPTISNTVTTAPNSVPNCDYRITTPSNGDTDVQFNPTLISWVSATGSPEGYYISIGSNEKGDNILNNINIGNVTSYSTLDLKPNTKYNLSLLPFNSFGLAKDCNGLFSFTTGAGGKKPMSDNSSNQIIKDRLRKMGVFNKWLNFNKNMPSRIYVSNIDTFLKTVKSYMGVPYRYGGVSKSGIDCSGLIFKGLQSVGYSGQRLNAQSIAKSGQLIAQKTALKKGDLVCFTNTTGANKLVHHIGTYVGNDEFIHAPSSGKSVKKGNINDPYYWGNKFIFGVRLTKN